VNGVQLSLFLPSSRAIGPAKRTREHNMTVMASWELFEDMREAQDELMRMNRLRAQRLGQLSQQYDVGTTSSAWTPAVDISERKDAYLVAVELPGVGVDDLAITFENGLLTIQGERPVTYDSSEETVHRMERRYGAFRRSITLPTHVQADAIEATARDGVLRILVPKAEEAHAKRIQVRVGDLPAVSAAGEETATSH
jgi:HSP20 family protein